MQLIFLKSSDSMRDKQLTLSNCYSLPKVPGGMVKVKMTLWLIRRDAIKALRAA
jgi:hypothetical protein